MNPLANAVNFLKEVKVQLLKVSWPTRSELIGATGVVILITAIATLFIGFVDLILSRILSWLFR
ncbi:MAG: preprotein translocase subunit SecE [Candidatus Omnitrophota bacterium]